MVLTCSNSIRYMLGNLCMSLGLPSLHHTPKRCIATTFPPIVCTLKCKLQVATPPMHHFGVRFARASEKNNYSDLNSTTRNGFRINKKCIDRTLARLGSGTEHSIATRKETSSCPKKTRLPYAYRRATSFFWALFFFHSCVT